MKLPQKPQQSTLFMVFQGTEINPGKNMGILHHGSLGPVQQPAQRPLILPSPPRDHAPHCSCKNPVSKWILSHGSHDQSLIDWESDSDFYSFTKLFMTCPRGLSVSSLSIPHPLNPLSSSHPRPVCCSITWARFWEPLLKASLSQSISLALASLLYPHHSLSSQHSSWPDIGFSYVFIVCLPPRRILFYYIIFYSCFPTQKKLCSQNQKDTFW